MCAQRVQTRPIRGYFTSFFVAILSSHRHSAVEVWWTGFLSTPYSSALLTPQHSLLLSTPYSSALLTPQHSLYDCAPTGGNSLQAGAQSRVVHERWGSESSLVSIHHGTPALKLPSAKASD